MKGPSLRSWLGIGVTAALLVCGGLVWVGIPGGEDRSGSSSKPQRHTRGVHSDFPSGRPVPGKAIDPDHPLTAAEYKKLHQEALARDSETDPRIRRLLELHGRYSAETGKLQPTIKEITAWINAAEPAARQERAKLFQDVLALTTLISRTYEWREDELRTLLEPDEASAVRIFAKGLVNQDIDPSALMGSTPQARAAVDDIHLKLYERLNRLVAESGAPVEHFNQQTYDLMINSALAGAFYGKGMQLSSPETQELAQAEYQMRVGGRLLRPGER
ncbi:hypothetical protein OVA24_15855 [Luteolibacter sp. SL250]|uniref:hypothetical protein n=1 Tax=Luteolibacter sp. SL250 TaxID=2995170 RepID=UPI00226E050C|nr:hypothetical protein [Luteolibacter sp. SL250]WAC18704.1 hypothetical protein OVA24_15855 [Luteolibacter sp. SL250]